MRKSSVSSTVVSACTVHCGEEQCTVFSSWGDIVQCILMTVTCGKVQKEVIRDSYRMLQIYGKTRSNGQFFRVYTRHKRSVRTDVFTIHHPHTETQSEYWMNETVDYKTIV